MSQTFLVCTKINLAYYLADKRLSLHNQKSWFKNFYLGIFRNFSIFSESIPKVRGIIVFIIHYKCFFIIVVKSILYSWKKCLPSNNSSFECLLFFYLDNKRQAVFIERHEVHRQLFSIWLSHRQDITSNLQPLQPVLQNLHFLALSDSHKILAHL